jgi:hypothetical protein
VTNIHCQSPNSIGFIVSVSSRLRPETGLGAYVSSNTAYGVYVFRMNTNHSHNHLPNPHKTSRLGKGKGTDVDTIYQVSYTVQRQAYMSPRIMQQITCSLMVCILRICMGMCDI